MHVAFEVQLRQELGMLHYNADKHENQTVKPSLVPAGFAAKLGEEHAAMVYSFFALVQRSTA